jgi:hypothetical protein
MNEQVQSFILFKNLDGLCKLLPVNGTVAMLNNLILQHREPKKSDPQWNYNMNITLFCHVLLAQPTSRHGDVFEPYDRHIWNITNCA